MRDWFHRLFFFLSFRVRELFAVPNPVRRDPNEYCPACGNRKGKITAVLVEPDQKGVKVAERHDCEICKFFWLEEAATSSHHVKNPLLHVPTDEDEEQAVRTMTADKRTKTIRTNKVTVNGQMAS